MAMGSLRLSVCVMMHLLLGASKPSSGDQNHCPCPKIPQRVLTKPPPETCYEVNSPYRYECLDGYVRKVGTSNLLKCRRDEDKPSYWTSPTLECIPDPRIVTTQPPTSTTNLNPRILTNHPADNTVTMNSIITTTVTATPTTVQTTRSLSTLASVEGETASTEPNPSDKSSVTPPVVQTTKSSTFSTGTTGSSVISTPAPFKGVAEAASATVSLVIVCAVIGIICLLYRRRRSENNKKQLPGEEATPMNVVSPEQQ